MQAQETGADQNIPKIQNIFGTDLYRLGSQYCPRFSFERHTVYQSKLGVFALFEFSELVKYQKWYNQGYTLSNYFFPSANLGISYDFKTQAGVIKVFAGLGGGMCKLYIGPMAGIYINQEKWSFKAMGLYSLATAYRADYSEDYIIAQGEQNVVYIRGFDPNSWYRFSAKYSLTENLKLGIISERFYSTGLVAEYEINRYPSAGLTLKTIIGKNLEINQNCYNIGLSINFK